MLRDRILTSPLPDRPTRPARPARERWQSTLVVGVLACGLLAACGSRVPEGEQLGAASSPGGLTAPGTAVGAQGTVVDTGAAPGTTGGTAGGTGGGAGTTPGSTQPGAGGTQPGTTTDPSAPGAPAPGAPGDGGSSPSKPGGPVKVGYVVAKDVGAAMSALGYSGLSTGDGATQAKAAIKLVNDAGGVGGHKIDPVIVELDATGDVSAQFVEACSTFFEDNAVQAVVAIYNDDQLRSCASKKGVPLVDGNISVPISTLSRFPNLLQPTMPTTEAGAAVLVDGLARSGWFKPSSATETVKVGLLTHDTADYDKVEGIVAGRLKAAGLSLTSTYEMPIDDIAGASNAGRSAALRFSTEGVNRVLAIDKNGFALSWFAVGASLQGYYPRLGMTTLSNPTLQPVVISPQALAGSAGIGWSPIFDTSPDLQPSSSARTGSCVAGMKAARENMDSPGARQGGLLVCEATYFLADAWGSGTTTLDSFLQGAAALGTSYKPVSSFGTSFGRSRSGASAYRGIAYEAGCDCFKYTGSTQRFAG